MSKMELVISQNKRMLKEGNLFFEIEENYLRIYSKFDTHRTLAEFKISWQTLQAISQHMRALNTSNFLQELEKLQLNQATAFSSIPIEKKTKRKGELL